MLRYIAVFLLLFSLNASGDGVDDQLFYNDQDQCTITIPPEYSINHYQFFNDYPECYREVFKGYGVDKNKVFIDKRRKQYLIGIEEKKAEKQVPEPPILVMFLAFLLCFCLVHFYQKRTTVVANNSQKK